MILHYLSTPFANLAFAILFISLGGVFFHFAVVFHTRKKYIGNDDADYNFSHGYFVANIIAGVISWILAIFFIILMFDIGATRKDWLKFTDKTWKELSWKERAEKAFQPTALFRGGGRAEFARDVMEGRAESAPPLNLF